MPITYGLTPQGFVSKPLSQVQSEIDTSLKGILGASAGTEPDGTIPLKSVAGQLKVFLTDAVSAMWDIAQAVYTSFDPNYATGNALDAIASITGTVREAARFSTVTATCCGTPGTVLQPTRVATVSVSGTRFDSVSIATIAVLPSWVGSFPYSVGARVTNFNKCYQCITSGTSAATGGPNVTYSNILDGTARWEYLGVGTGAIDVPFVAEAAGAFGASSRTLVNIATPVSGWSSVLNLSDASVGAATEGDQSLRSHREEELAASGNSTADSIRANMLKVNATSTDSTHSPVISCTVFHNDTDVTDTNSVPPHAVEVLVYYGSVDIPTTDQDIANAVFASVAAGIATYGNQTNTVVDSQGVSHSVSWSKPQTINIYVTTSVYFDPTKWPTMVAPYTLVKQSALSALLTAGDSYPVGESVRAAPLIAAIMDGPAALDNTGSAVVPAPVGSVPTPGVLDVSPMYIGAAPSPGTSSPVTIGPRQLAVFDSSRTSITAIPEAP